jgi:hypothetical protein
VRALTVVFPPRCASPSRAAAAICPCRNANNYGGAAVVLGLVPKTANPPRAPWLALILLVFWACGSRKRPRRQILAAYRSSGPSSPALARRARLLPRQSRPLPTALPWFILCAPQSRFLHVFIINTISALPPPNSTSSRSGSILVLVAMLPWTILLSAVIFGTENRQAARPGACPIRFCSCFTILEIGYFCPPPLGLACKNVQRSPPFERSPTACPGGSAVFISLRPPSLRSHWRYVLSERQEALCVILFSFVRISYGCNRTVWSGMLPASPSSADLVAMFGAQTVPYFKGSFRKTIAREPASGISARRRFPNGRGSTTFEFHQEISDWDSAHPRVGYFLWGGKDCKRIVSGAVSCADPPIYLQSSDRFLYRVTPAPSLDRLGDGGKPKQKE